MSCAISGVRPGNSVWPNTQPMNAGTSTGGAYSGSSGIARLRQAPARERDQRRCNPGATARPRAGPAAAPPRPASRSRRRASATLRRCDRGVREHRDSQARAADASMRVECESWHRRQARGDSQNARRQAQATACRLRPRSALLARARHPQCATPDSSAVSAAACKPRTARADLTAVDQVRRPAWHAQCATRPANSGDS